MSAKLAVIGGSQMLSVTVRKIGDLAVGETKLWHCRADLKCIMRRSHRRPGRCEFSARLLNPLCERCSTPGINSAYAAE